MDPNRDAAPWRDRVQVQVAAALIEGGTVALKLLQETERELTEKQRKTPYSFRFALIAQRLTDAIIYTIEHRETKEPADASGGGSWS